MELKGIVSWCSGKPVIGLHKCTVWWQLKAFHIYTIPLRYISVLPSHQLCQRYTNFPKLYTTSSKLYAPEWWPWGSFHTEDTQILGTMLRNLLVRDSCTTALCRLQNGLSTYGFPNKMSHTFLIFLHACYMSCPSHTFLIFLHACYMSCPSYSSRFNYHNNIYGGADKSLSRPGRKQANVSVRMAWISFGALPCRKRNLLTTRILILLK